MNSKLLFLLLLIFLFVSYNFLTYENFGSWENRQFENLLKQKFGLSSNDNLDTYNAITTDSSKHVNNTTQTEIDGKLYDLNSFRFSKLFSLSQKYLNIDENSEINTKIVYTDEEKNKIIEKMLQTNVGDSVWAFTNIFYNDDKLSLIMDKKYLHWQSELYEDDNIFYIINKDLNFKLNDSLNDYFKDSRLDLKDDLRDKIMELEKIINFIKNNYNHNDIQAIVIDGFLLNIGIILKEEFKKEVNDNFINFTLKFKVDIYNYEFEGRKLNFPYAKFVLLENSYFIENKLWMSRNVIGIRVHGILDNDPQMKKINELRKKIEPEVKLDLREKYKISLEILSILFSDEEELTNHIFSKVMPDHLDYINVNINESPVNFMKLRNLMVLDDVINDFKAFKLKSSPSPSYIETFSNMCEDLKLENGKKYVDNELLKGYTCEDYSKHGLCEDKKPTRIYYEDIMNLNNLSPKDACCVCGGGKNTEQSQSSNDEESNNKESNNKESNDKESNDEESNDEESNNKESNNKESNNKESNDEESNNKSNITSRGRSVIQFRPKGPANIFLPELKIK